jgi:hypothetical protein
MFVVMSLVFVKNGVCEMIYIDKSLLRRGTDLTLNDVTKVSRKLCNEKLPSYRTCFVIKRMVLQ